MIEIVRGTEIEIVTEIVIEIVEEIEMIKIRGKITEEKRDTVHEAGIEGTDIEAQKEVTDVDQEIGIHVESREKGGPPVESIVGGNQIAGKSKESHHECSSFVPHLTAVCVKLPGTLKLIGEILTVNVIDQGLVVLTDTGLELTPGVVVAAEAARVMLDLSMFVADIVLIKCIKSTSSI